MDRKRKIKTFSKEYGKIKDLVGGWSDYQKTYYRVQFRRYQTLFSIITREYDRKEKLLDIGISPGYFTYTLRKMGYQVEAVDLSPQRIDTFIKKEVPVSKTDIEKKRLPFQDNSFDGILFMALLEHLRINPLFTLREIWRVLKPGGRLLLQTPNLSWWETRLRVLLGQGFDVSPYFAYSLLEKEGHAGHIRVYNMKEALEILEESNFQIKDYYWVNNGELVLKRPHRGLLSSHKRQIIIIATKSRGQK